MQKQHKGDLAKIDELNDKVSQLQQSLLYYGETSAVDSQMLQEDYKQLEIAKIVGETNEQIDQVNSANYSRTTEGSAESVSDGAAGDAPEDKIGDDKTVGSAADPENNAETKSDANAKIEDDRSE